MLRLLAWTASSLLLSAASCATAPAPAAPAPSGTRPAARAEPLVEGTPARAGRRERIRELLPKNVRLLTREEGEVVRTASGVAIASEQTAEGGTSWVLTNAHAVAGDKGELRVVVAGARGEESEYPAEVLATGQVPDMDLALLRVKGVALPAARLADVEELEVGEEVVVAASPYGRALSLSGGMVSQVEWDQATRLPRSLKTDAPIGYGASGGGIFSVTTGHLLAIVEGYRTARVGFDVAKEHFSFDVPMPGETFAAPASKVLTFLRARGFQRLIAQGPAEAGATVEARR